MMCLMDGFSLQVLHLTDEEWKYDDQWGEDKSMNMYSVCESAERKAQGFGHKLGRIIFNIGDIHKWVVEEEKREMGHDVFSYCNI